MEVGSKYGQKDCSISKERTDYGHWTYNGVEIHVVNDFNYLGAVFNNTGSFALDQQIFSGKTLKAMNILLQHIRGLILYQRSAV